MKKIFKGKKMTVKYQYHNLKPSPNPKVKLSHFYWSYKMTSRELVRKTLEFDSPARIPRDVWILPCARKKYPAEVEQLLNDFPSDIVECPKFYRCSPKTVGDVFALGTYVDEWGCTFTNVQEGITGKVKKPLVKTWDELDKVKPPKEMLTIDIGKINEFCNATNKFVLSIFCPRPFERLQFIRGSQATYFDLAKMSDEFKILLKRIHAFYLEVLQVWAKTDVDALMFMDDWGSQNSLLIHPQLWRKVFKPLYREYIEVAHSRNKKIFMHSDGYIIDIIPDLIELGLDALNSQIFCMDIEELGKRFKGKITFWGEIDRQHILAHGSEEDVTSAVKLVKNCLYQEGGVIAQCEYGPGAKPKNVQLVFETWKNLSKP